MSKLKVVKKEFIVLFFLIHLNLFSQETIEIQGQVQSKGIKIEFAQVQIVELKKIRITDINGGFIFDSIPFGSYTIKVIDPNYEVFEEIIYLTNLTNEPLIFELKSLIQIDEVVVSGTMKTVLRSESPVVVDILTTKFLKKNPTPSIFDALQTVNGVRPQLNCNVCNTGDIHINGLEGPYTMVLIDGMPIVSSLSTVYGLSGIPNSLVDRIEIIKGPASSLYGSEAVGGLINIITKPSYKAPKLTVDVFGTSWGELSTDLGFKFTIGKKATVLNAINYYNFQQIIDKNADHFTDLTLQNRISFFQKWNFERKENRIFTISARYMYEDRWGGDIDWSSKFRGGDSIYGESIYTNRVELLGKYELPTKEKMFVSFSLTNHQQNSVYGQTKFNAKQSIGFIQYTWDKKVNKHDLLIGSALRYTYYDDNTAATIIENEKEIKNNPSEIMLPGIFVQDEINFTEKQKLLLGLRYDYNSFHGSIVTPRIAYKYSFNSKNTFRLNMGSGYRIVNLFTEDHAALTGSRTVEIVSELNPEKSYNLNLNYMKNIYMKKGLILSMDLSCFYTYFNNRILADYLSDPNKIIYNNLNGYAESKGLSLNSDFSFKSGLKILIGATYIENSLTESKVKRNQLLTEKFSGVWTLSYKIKKIFLSIDYTGNLYSPMELPLLSELDPRDQFSPWWSIQNIQVTFDKFKQIEIYGGVKNLLNWTPFKENEFTIARSNDPFDKGVQFDSNGNTLVTSNNPYGLTFDPTYIYAPTQGIRLFLGFRYNLK